jgi:hypothetical protein
LHDRDTELLKCPYSNWRWPNIDGLNSFKGSLVHTANWDESLNLNGKRVLNIGVGSSGVQTIPTIIDKVDRLFVAAVSSSCVWMLVLVLTYHFSGLQSGSRPGKISRAISSQYLLT